MQKIRPTLAAVERPTTYTTHPVTDWKALYRLTMEKNIAVARGFFGLSLLNVASIVFLAGMLHALTETTQLAHFRHHALPALAAFVFSTIVTSLIYGSRTGAVILRMIGHRSALRLRSSTVIAFVLGMGSFLVGVRMLVEGLQPVI